MLIDKVKREDGKGYRCRYDKPKTPYHTNDLRACPGRFSDIQRIVQNFHAERLCDALRHVRRITQNILITLIMIPMWMNFLIRTYAWMTILQDTGILNGLLARIGLGQVHIIGTEAAVGEGKEVRNAVGRKCCCVSRQCCCV